MAPVGSLGRIQSGSLGRNLPRNGDHRTDGESDRQMCVSVGCCFFLPATPLDKNDSSPTVFLVGGGFSGGDRGDGEGVAASGARWESWPNPISSGRLGVGRNPRRNASGSTFIMLACCGVSFFSSSDSV